MSTLIERASLAIVVGCVLAVAACGDGERPPVAGAEAPAADSGARPNGPGSDPDGSTGNDGATADADAGPQCIGPAFGAGTVTAQVLTGGVPGPLGGALVPGTYDLTGYELYAEAGSDGEEAVPPPSKIPTARATFVLTASSFELTKMATPLTGGAAIDMSVRASARGADEVFLVTDVLCPESTTVNTPYTATETTIILQTATKRREIYTRRP